MNKVATALVLLLGLNFPTGQASEIEFSGFATLAGGITTDSDESLEGYDDSFNMTAGSLVGIQASSDLDNGWGFTTQLVSRGEDNWEINAEWAFLSYETSNDWRFLFGRQRAPFYVYSDYLDVSYAYHWIAPPSGVYSLPFDTFDGIGAIKNTTLGSFDSSFHFTFGRNTDDFEVEGVLSDSDFNDFFSFAWTLSKDWFTFRASYAKSSFTVLADALTPLTDGWRATGFENVASGIEIIDDTGDFKGIGIIIDYDNFLIVSEFTQINPEDNFFAPNDSYYVSFGYRFDSGMFHISAGADDNEAAYSLLNGPSAFVAANPTNPATPLIQGLIDNTTLLFLSNEEDTSFVKIGYKWDLDSPISIKAELTKFDDKFVTDSDATLLQFAIVTVF